MQFTPQQLVGAGRYNPATRIGNWNEDLMLEEARMKEFQLRKRQGSLLATHRQKNDFLQVCVPRSFDTQGTIRFGQYVSIGHLESDGLISTNVFEETPSIGSGEYIVTVASSKDALSRNIFRIMPAAAFKESGDWNTSTLLGGVVKYGEPFVLMCNESLLVDDKSVLLKPPMFLKSGLKTDRSMSPITYNQRIWLSEEVDANALWTVERADLSGPEKLLASGNELKAGDAVSFVHKMTGQLLYADSKNKQPTDFGLEIEISAFCSKTAGKHHNLAAEKLGKRTGDTEGRVALPTNVWTFVLASSTEETKDTRSLPEIATVASVARVIQQCLSASSLYGFRIFLQGLAKLEGKNTGIINRDEAKWYITQYKFPLRNEHIEVLLGALDKRNVGHLSTSELMNSIRIPLSTSRKAAIQATYDRLSSGASLSASTLLEMYDTSIDSRVRDGKLSKEEAIKEYKQLWPNAVSISCADFVEVYSDVSPVVEVDAHFNQLLQESWR